MRGFVRGKKMTIALRELIFEKRKKEKKGI